MGRIIGIDLGTTNSVAAFMSRRRPKIIKDPRNNSDTVPSVVLFERGQQVIGQDARARHGSRHRIYSIKRFMGVDYDSEQIQKTLKEIVGYSTRPAANGETEVMLGDEYYSPTQISAMILGQMKENAELVLGEPVTRAVITVPAYFNQRQKAATREAGRLAGLQVERILNEPTAAALAFGTDLAEDENELVLVYDLGGGTFDVSIMNVSPYAFDVFNYDGDNFLGGDNFDGLIVEVLFVHLQRQYGIDLRENLPVKDRLKHLAEQAKIALSLQPQTQIMAEQIETINGVPINLDVVLTRQEFDALISPLVQRTLEITRRALLGAHLDVSDIDRVLLVGGSTRVPLVRSQLCEFLGDRLELDVDPMQCVALGAAVMAGMIDEDRDEGPSALVENVRERDPNSMFVPSIPAPPAHEIIDITSKHLGIEVEDVTAVSTKKLKIIVEKQTQVPTEMPKRGEVYTREPNQQRYQLPVYEVEATTVEEAEAAPRERWEHVGLIENDKLPPGLPTNTPVMVEMSIDADSILTVSSYLKSDPEHTFVRDSFRFIGAAAQRSIGNNRGKGTEDKAVDELKFYHAFYGIIVDDPSVNAYLHKGQDVELRTLLVEIEGSLSVQDPTEVEKVLNRARKLRSNLPVPTEDVLFAKVFMAEAPLSEQRQIQQSLYAMEQAIAQNHIDRANQHLSQLRQVVGVTANKKTSQSYLLRYKRE